MRPTKLLLCGVLVAITSYSSATAAEVPAPDADGWHSWQVDAPDISSEICCFTRKNGGKSQRGCHLDDRGIGFSGRHDNCETAPGTLHVYVRMRDGTPADIQILSSNCPVSTETALVDHGLVSAEENLRWFRHVIEDRKLSRTVREEALFALVMSESDAAYTYLDKLLSRR